MVLLSSRGDHGYGPGGRLAADNHVERGVLTPLRYIGIECAGQVAVEYDEFADGRLQASLRQAEAGVDALVDRLLAEVEARAAAA